MSSSRPTYLQLEALINFLEANPGIAKGHLRSAQAKWETKRKWDQITVSLNAIGGTQKDAKGWTKYWSDKKYALKRILGQRNASANRTGGGGPEKFLPLTEIEERMLALLGGRGFAEGDPQFSVSIHQSQDQPSTSTHPDTHISEEVVTEPLPNTPLEHVASFHSTPRRSPRFHTQSPTRLTPRVRIRTSQQPTERGRRTNMQMERERLIRIEERRMEAELIHARALQENLARLDRIADAFTTIGEAISTTGQNISNAINNLVLMNEK